MISEYKFFGCICLLLLILNGCSSTDILLRPTGKAAFVPDNEVEFTQYIKDSSENIIGILDTLRPLSENREYLGGYTNQEAALMSSPFQIPPTESGRCDDVAKGAKKGFLLIHGLAYSPYIMKNIAESLHKQYECALIRAVLLPGHGTVVGDTLDVHHQDWEKIVSYGVNSFKNDDNVAELYLVGFSAGTSLAISYLKENKNTAGYRTPREDKIKGLVLFSTAVKAKTSFAFLTPIIKSFKEWLTEFKERDAARYESFAMNAGAEFYELTKRMMNQDYTLDIPVLMAVSADDATVNAKAAREFFCFPTRIKRRALFWYQSIDPEVNYAINFRDTPELMCDNIVEVELKSMDPQYNTVNMAHIALPVSPDDPHYGFNGKYRNCKAYDQEKSADEFEECVKQDKKSVFGEWNLKDLKDELKLEFEYLRRGTFNPDYKNLEAKIFCFTNDNCPTSELLKLP